ncbi:MAG: monooxygenase [Reyranella sp.]|uniref:flavin-containing monooxygenase n=1 Tax=Reyranella sp. TaxID=1929291 RepID=UPI0012139B88|nr:NAD(P)/FAD-dependent oxidoreductase [Reyranella sp.]TAJ37609.1 MAG: monooxygenase [Reyranella sp.]
MDVELNRDAKQIVGDWLLDLNAALQAGDWHRLAALFRSDCDWRDIVALTWTIETVSDREPVARRLIEAVTARGAGNFAVDPERHPPRDVERAGEDCVEAILSFETRVGWGAGIVRLKRSDCRAGAAMAWTLLTTLDELRGYEEETILENAEEPAFERDFHGPNWLDRRRQAAAYDDREPDVLIVGGGHAGITAAARLKGLGIEALVVDRMERIGDNWRKRYHGLKLHNQKHSNHFPYLPFPKTWPKYIAKDKIANWLESYVETLEIDFWTRTTFKGATWDDKTKRWTANLALDVADGAGRTLHPRHIIMATSVSGTPNIPEIPTLDRFKGQIVHSSRFGNGGDWKGRNVYVFGTGTSAHDIAQDLHGNGAHTTIVQRSPTLIVNVEPSAQLYDGIYYGKGPTYEDRDLINVSVPLRVMKQAHRLLTDKARELDAPLLQALEKVGFRLEFGENGTGWPLKYRSRGGGYYFNVGASDLIAKREIGLIQYADIAEFTETGMKMKDGSERPADLIVLATGYKGQDHLVGELFGPDVARKVGAVWGFDARTQELNNMWVPTAQPGLWFTGGSFAQCRMYSKYLALQIKAQDLGLA